MPDNNLTCPECSSSAVGSVESYKNKEHSHSAYSSECGEVCIVSCTFDKFIAKHSMGYMSRVRFICDNKQCDYDKCLNASIPDADVINDTEELRYHIIPYVQFLISHSIKTGGLRSGSVAS